MDLITTIERIQDNKGNERPRVAYYIQLAWKQGRCTELRQELNELVATEKLIWGKTPHTIWFATNLDSLDREIIEGLNGWTIENY